MVTSREGQERVKGFRDASYYIYKINKLQGMENLAISYFIITINAI